MAHSGRWCALCFDGEVVFCNHYEKPMSEKAAKRTNMCPHFQFVPIDAFDEIKYDPERGKKKGKKADVKIETMALF